MSGRRRILLVEDDASNALALTALLEDVGWRVQHARSCAEARAALGGDAPDIVLLDMGLPDGDGRALIPEIRAAHPRARLIQLSGDERRSDGVDGAFVKGASSRALLDLVEAQRVVSRLR